MHDECGVGTVAADLDSANCTFNPSPARHTCIWAEMPGVRVQPLINILCPWALREEGASNDPQALECYILFTTVHL